MFQKLHGEFTYAKKVLIFLSDHTVFSFPESGNSYQKKRSESLTVPIPHITFPTFISLLF